ncbi:MAG: hypothetical protein HUJ68_00450 [Clostridia bacterium]|nr:hypothetical protein [Clostridia bacterium]
MKKEKIERILSILSVLLLIIILTAIRFEYNVLEQIINTGAIETINIVFQNKIMLMWLISNATCTLCAVALKQQIIKKAKIKILACIIIIMLAGFSITQPENHLWVMAITIISLLLS